MPFLRGIAPVRYTQKYLEAGKIILQPEIKVMTVNYNVNQKASSGLYQFQFWHLPQIKYKNADLQIVRFKNMTPTPFIQFFFLNGEKQIVDAYDRSREEIHEHVLHAFCEQPPEKQAYYYTQKTKFNPANFGFHCDHWCICEIPGQRPCPGYTPMPRTMKGKYQQSEES
ncbi:probable 28S ribosomal protein S25, mitochondrial [Mya arenaria]|uniref:probable 28S ribosomal protein S25, mitochondrial n=1 Tax=Mya arenaria TaxID=6604 RepID=UPI0022E0D668|nr:probable 28S ribosomal protein S25, mitochondrial [Mya arenaria]